MSRQQVRSGDIENEGVRREDLNVSTPGQAVVRKLIQGSGIVLSATGADAGTGDVTVSLSADVELNTLGVSTSLFVEGDGSPFLWGSKLLALGLIDRGDLLRWKSPLSAERYNFTAEDWVAYAAPNWKLLTDGKGDTRVALSYDYRKVRLTYDLGVAYSMGAYLVIQRNYSWPVNQVKVTVEDSDNNSAYSSRVAERTLSLFDSVLVRPDDGASLYRRYVRITLEFNNGSSDTVYLAGLQLWTFRAGDQGGAGLHKQLPLDWNEDREVSLVNHLKLPAGKAVWVAGDPILIGRQNGITLPSGPPYYEYGSEGFSDKAQIDDLYNYVNAIRQAVEDLASRLSTSHGLIDVTNLT